MTSIITGDIINSRQAALPNDYLDILRATLSEMGKEHIDWEIFRGDSFQVEINHIKDSFWKCVYLKAALKSKENLDVRMAIGIGEKSYSVNRVAENNGPAFIRSGTQFEKLKKEKTNLLIETGKASLDGELNICFRLALIAMDHWTRNSAEIIKLSIANPDLNQQELGALIGIKQNTVSERQKRASWDELQLFDQLFRKKIQAL